MERIEHSSKRLLQTQGRCMRSYTLSESFSLTQIGDIPSFGREINLSDSPNSQVTQWHQTIRHRLQMLVTIRQSAEDIPQLAMMVTRRLKGLSVSNRTQCRIVDVYDCHHSPHCQRTQAPIVSDIHISQDT